MTMNDDLAAHAEAYLQGELDEQQRASLLRRLEADPVAADAFIAVLRDHRLIDAWYHRPDGDALAGRVRQSLKMGRESQIQRRSAAVRDRIAHLPKRHKRRTTTIPWPGRAWPGRAWPGLLTAAAALLVCVIAYWRWPAETETVDWVATLAAGPTTTVDGQQVHGEQQLTADALVACSETVSLRYRDGSVAQLSGRLRLQAHGGFLEAGSIDCAVEKQPADQRFAIATRDGRVTVIGTRFTVTVAADSLLVVDEGLVQVDTMLGSSAEIGAGLEARFHRDRSEISKQVSTGSWRPAAELGSWRNQGSAPVAADGDALRFSLDSRSIEGWQSRWHIGTPVGSERMAQRLELEFDWPGQQAATDRGKQGRASIGVALASDLQPNSIDEGQPHGFIRISLTGDRLSFCIDRDGQHQFQVDVGPAPGPGIQRLAITRLGNEVICELNGENVYRQDLPEPVGTLYPAFECGSRDFGPQTWRFLRFRSNPE